METKKVKTNDFREMCENTRVELQSWKAVKRAFLSLENDENADFVEICKFYFADNKREKDFRLALCEKANKKTGKVSYHVGKLIINKFIKNCINDKDFEKLPIYQNLLNIRKIYFAKKVEKQNKQNAEK